MKKLFLTICALVALSIPAFAVMDDVTASRSLATTTASTNSYIVRGTVEGVLVTIPTAKTATVSVTTSSGSTLFTGTALTSSTDGYFPIRYQVYNSSGTAQTYLSSTAANSITNLLLDKIGIADTVNLIIIPDGNTTGTNTYSLKLIVDK